MGLGVVGILDGSWGHLSPVPSESRWVDSTARTMHFKFLTGNSDVKHICLSIIGLLKAFMCDLLLTTLVSSLAYSEKPFIGRHIMSYYCSSTRLVRPSQPPLSNRRSSGTTQLLLLQFSGLRIIRDSAMKAEVGAM